MKGLIVFVQLQRETEERERQEQAEAEEKALRSQRQAEWVSCFIVYDICTVDVNCVYRSLSWLM